MSNDLSVTPSFDPGPQRLLAETRDQTPPDDALTSLSDEFALLDVNRARREAREDKNLAMFESETPSLASENSTPAPTDGRFSRRNITLAVLAILVVAQGGLMAFWMLTRSAATAVPGTGSLTVTSEPSGSPVTIDGSPLGATPLTVALKTGDHQVAVGAGAQARLQTLNITAGSNAIHLASVAATAPGAVVGTGGLQIATDPAGARVSIDGEAKGITPLNLSDVAIGDHVVTVRGASGDEVNRTVRVREATVASLMVAMNGPAAFASGWLAVKSAVPLQILEKGELVGSTDTPRILLPAGAHELSLVNSALDYSVTRSVRITAGQSTAIELTTPKGSLSINALPWAEVWIDGQRIGETPIGNLSIAVGQHEVLFRNPELGEQRKAVIVGVQTPARIGVDMKKP